MKSLTQIHAEIDTRVKTISNEHSDWLCRMGCDSCCKRLAEIPKLTAAEWDLLQDGLTALPPQLLLAVERDIMALTEQTSRPMTCPMLNLAQGTCMVYNHRPVACRTYGFYVQRDKGLFCKDIESQVAEGNWATVVWGNHDAIDLQLNALGDSRDLTEWFALWQKSS